MILDGRSAVPVLSVVCLESFCFFICIYFAWFQFCYGFSRDTFTSFHCWQEQIMVPTSNEITLMK